MPILVNPVPILGQSEDICLDNLGTSALYGVVSIPLGGRNSCHPVATQCKLDANPGPILGTIQNQSDPFFVNSSQCSTNWVPIWCQSKVNFSVHYQFSNFQKWSIFPFNNNFPISQSWPIHANRPIQCQSSANQPIPGQSANPRPILCHYWEPFPHLTKEQVLYGGWYLVHSEGEFKTIEHSQFSPIQYSAGQPMPMLVNQVPIPG